MPPPLATPYVPAWRSARGCLKRRFACALVAVPALLAAAAACANDAPWQALRQGGHVALLRHAVTEPGTGDPPGFRLGECNTQRNLSAEGRAQARRLGAEFQRHGVAVTAVLSSHWCRCLDTARLAFGQAVPWAALDSFFANAERSGPQSAELRRRIAGFSGSGTLVLVTHQVNITALTGLVPAQGELVVLAPTPEGGRVVGRLPPP